MFIECMCMYYIHLTVYGNGIVHITTLDVQFYHIHCTALQELYIYNMY